MATAIAALGDATRRQILDLLLDDPQPVGALVAALGVSQPGVSKHLRVLRQAGLVHAHAVGQQRIYELRTEPLEAIDAWLAPYRRMWSAQLDALQRHLDRRD
jgi:DNA-binding transcriptional ArsR family regulator